MYIIGNLDVLRGGPANIKKIVANLSLGGPQSTVIDNSVLQLIQNNIAVTVSAGNSNDDACFTSPARLEEVLTVASSTINDQKSSFSNYGSCVDLSAPGSQILAAWIGSNTATNTISGTSMAAPFVAGALALIWQQNKALTNIQVQNKLKEWVTPNIISGSSFNGGGKNLLYTLVDPNSPNPSPVIPPTIPNESILLINNLIIYYIIILIYCIIK